MAFVFKFPALATGGRNDCNLWRPRLKQTNHMRAMRKECSERLQVSPYSTLRPPTGIYEGTEKMGCLVSGPPPIYQSGSAVRPRWKVICGRRSCPTALWVNQRSTGSLNVTSFMTRGRKRITHRGHDGATLARSPSMRSSCENRRDLFEVDWVFCIAAGGFLQPNDADMTGVWMLACKRTHLHDVGTKTRTVRIPT